jgi:hypothetical protein
METPPSNINTRGNMYMNYKNETPNIYQNEHEEFLKSELLNKLNASQIYLF